MFGCGIRQRSLGKSCILSYANGRFAEHKTTRCCVKDSPTITFKSTNVVQTGPNTFDLEGDFTIRGVTKKEKLTLTDNGKGSTSGSIAGTMAFDRKDYGMNSSIPFIKIANRVEVNVSMKWTRVSGPPPVFQQ